jgi:hypothetical protein
MLPAARFRLAGPVLSLLLVFFYCNPTPDLWSAIQFWGRIHMPWLIIDRTVGLIHLTAFVI